MGDNMNLNMPPGFRFYPSDEELVVHFLQRKASLLPCHPDVIPDLHLYPYDPWDLQGRAMCEGNKWYYYSRRTQSRITASGYWQALGIEETIYSSTSAAAVAERVGTKKYNAFYLGQPNSGVKTNWIMQEYRLTSTSAGGDHSTSTTRSPNSSRRNHSSRTTTIDYSKWLVCRVYERNSSDCSDNDDDDGTELSCLDEVFLSLDDLDEISLPNYM